MEVHERSVIVNAPVDDVFRLWRNWEDFPKYMSHVKEVQRLDGNMTHWEGSIAGIDEVWDAKTTKYIEDAVIAWESVNGFRNKGQIDFDDMNGRTKVTVHFEYDPPGGVAGKAVDKVFLGRQFDQSLEQDLNRFKDKAEQDEGD